jgi:hypothetical protein
MVEVIRTRLQSLFLSLHTQSTNSTHFHHLQPAHQTLTPKLLFHNGPNQANRPKVHWRKGVSPTSTTPTLIHPPNLTSTACSPVPESSSLPRLPRRPPLPLEVLRSPTGTGPEPSLFVSLPLEFLRHPSPFLYSFSTIL